MLFVVFVVETLGDDGTGLGVIRGMMAIGALLGSAAISRLAERIQPPTLFAIGLLGMGAVSLVFWNAPTVTTTLWVYVVLFSLAGFPGAALAVGLFTTLQKSTPSYALGRVTGILAAGEALGVGAGAMLTGVLVDYVDLRVLLNAQAAIYLGAGLLAFVLMQRQPAFESSQGSEADVTRSSGPPH